MDAAAVQEETAGAADTDAPVAAGAIAGAAARDVMAVNCQLRNTLRIARTSQPNNKGLQNHLSPFCCPASRCQY